MYLTIHSGTHIVFFFFFQAEDGIRDGRVTGVQTCALPISSAFAQSRAETLRYVTGATVNTLDPNTPGSTREAFALSMSSRSEERRVGKECRSRWSTYQ